MAVNKTSPIRNTLSGRLLQVWRYLTEAHPSVREIGERRRAQLLAALSLILTASFVLALLSSPVSFTIFDILLALTLASYLLSRTRYYRVGAYFFSFGFTSLAFITIYLGTAITVESTIFAFIPAAVILSSAILSQRGFGVLAVTTVIATDRPDGPLLAPCEDVAAELPQVMKGVLQVTQFLTEEHAEGVSAREHPRLRWFGPDPRIHPHAVDEDHQWPVAVTLMKPRIQHALWCFLIGL